MSVLVAIGATLAHAIAVPPSRIEEQYLQLFDDHNSTVSASPRNCVSLSLGDGSNGGVADGSFIMPSLGQFQMNGMQVNGALDAYGKLSRFTISGSRVCFAARQMETAFWNASVAAGRVAPGLLFYETTPPRGYSAMHNLNGPNDSAWLSLGPPSTCWQSAPTCCVISAAYFPCVLPTPSPDRNLPLQIRMSTRCGSASASMV